MGCKPEISDVTRKAIEVLRNEKKSLKAISELLKIPKTTVYDTLKRFETHGTFKSLKRTGRPRAITPSVHAKILRLAKISDKPNAVSIEVVRNELGRNNATNSLQ